MTFLSLKNYFKKKYITQLFRRKPLCNSEESSCLLRALLPSQDRDYKIIKVMKLA